MENNNSNLFFKILNIWFAFIVVLFFSSYLPRWENVTIHSWINEAIYFFLFVLAVAITRKERNNRDIYINLSLFLLAYSFSFLNIFIGDDYLLGNNRALLNFYVYKRIILCFFANLAIFYIVIKYLFRNQKVWFLYSITLFLLVTLMFVHFYSYFINPEYVYSLKGQLYSDLNRRLFFLLCFSLFLILLYAYFLYKTDNILGSQINLLMTFFFIFVIFDMSDSLSEMYNFHVYSIALYVCSFNLIFLCIILLKKLLFVSSDFGQFYEALITNRINMGKLKIQRYRSQMNALLIRFLRSYLSKRYIYILSLIFIVAITVIHFQFPTFFTINLIVLSLSIIVLFYFIFALYKRRGKKKYTLP